MMDLHNNLEGRRAAAEGRPINPANLRTFPGQKKRVLLMRALRGKYISIFLASTSLMACSPDTDQVTLVNRANKNIRSVSVAIHDRAMEFGPLAPAQKITMTFIGAHGEDYHVIVRFDDGKRLEANVGYITSGISSTDTIEVHGDKVQLD